MLSLYRISSASSFLILTSIVSIRDSVDWMASLSVGLGVLELEDPNSRFYVNSHIP
ncbi:hypothetical protein PGTUg99_019610, partial [Puccinia graminis f. sp. tritici]